MRADRRAVIALLAFLAVSLAPASPARAAQTEDNGGHSPIVIVGTVLTNIVYLPTKVAYSILGGVTGVVTYPLTVGNTDVTTAIWDTCCRGTYVVTPDMLEGKEPIRFKGP